MADRHFLWQPWLQKAAAFKNRYRNFIANRRTNLAKWATLRVANGLACAPQVDLRLKSNGTINWTSHQSLLFAQHGGPPPPHRPRSRAESDG